jgi:hypothetical protein
LGVVWEEHGVGGCRDAGQALKQGGGWGVQELIGDAEDALIANCAEIVPVALLDDAAEGDAVPCSAPCEEQDLGLFVFGQVGDGFGGGVGAGLSEEGSAGGFDEFGDPVLGVDEGPAPLFAVDDGFGGSLGCDGTGLHQGLVDLMEEGFALRGGLYQGRDEADVVDDVGEAMGREGEDGEAGLEDGGEGLHAIGDAGDDDVGPGRLEDFEIAGFG